MTVLKLCLMVNNNLGKLVTNSKSSVYVICSKYLYIKRMSRNYFDPSFHILPYNHEHNSKFPFRSPNRKCQRWRVTTQCTLLRTRTQVQCKIPGPASLLRTKIRWWWFPCSQHQQWPLLDLNGAGAPRWWLWLVSSSAGHSEWSPCWPPQRPTLTTRSKTTTGPTTSVTLHTDLESQQ